MFVSKMLPSKNTAQSQQSQYSLLQHIQVFYEEVSNYWCSIYGTGKFDLQLSLLGLEKGFSS